MGVSVNTLMDRSKSDLLLLKVNALKAISILVLKELDNNVSIFNPLPQDFENNDSLREMV